MKKTKTITIPKEQYDEIYDLIDGIRFNCMADRMVEKSKELLKVLPKP